MCRICNTERQNVEYHKLYKRGNKGNIRCPLKYYYANRGEELERKEK